MKVLNVLKNKPICNEAHFILIGLVLTIISVRHTYFIIFMIIYIFYILKKLPKLLIPTLLICFLFSFLYVQKNKDVEQIESINGNFIVINEDDYYYVLKGEYKVLISKDNLNLNLGDKIEADIKIIKWGSPSYEYDFNSKEYYKSLGIYYRGKITNYDLLEEELSIYKIRYYILSFYEKRLKDKSFSYFKALLFNENNIDNNIVDAYSNLYITHLLVISGMHLVIIYKILMTLFQKIFKIEGKIIVILVLFLYLYLIDFPISAVRAFLIIILSKLNDIGTIRYTELDIFSFSFIFLSLFNPLLCYQMSFILSFLVSFLLLFINDILKFKSRLLKNLLTSFLCILITLPFSINISNRISLVNLLISPVMTLILSTFLLPMTLLMIVLPLNMFECIYSFIDQYLLFMDNSLLTFNFPSLSFIQIIMYYVLFFCFLYYRKRKILIILILFTFFSANIYSLYSYPKVTFIDVGQGDSTLIELPHRKKVILIDTFNNIDYLKSIGINKIDILVLTHFDNDHIGSLDELINEFNVKKIYCSYYEKNNMGIKMEKIKSGNIINMDELKLEVVSPIIDLKDSNANSLVIRFSISGKNFLLMGDATTEAEALIIDKYGNKLSSDVLKVGHHGSNTSTSNELLKVVKPKIALISVGNNNIYGLPSVDVISRVKKYSDVYLTSNRGNITITVKDNRLIIDCYK